MSFNEAAIKGRRGKTFSLIPWEYKFALLCSLQAIRYDETHISRAQELSDGFALLYAKMEPPDELGKHISDRFVMVMREKCGMRTCSYVPSHGASNDLNALSYPKSTAKAYFCYIIPATRP